MRLFGKNQWRVTAWPLCVAMLYSIVPSSAFASDTVRVCNESETRAINVATVNNYWHGGAELWKESGWYTVDARHCEVISNIRPFHAVGFAFQVMDGETIHNPVVKFDTFAAQKTLRMCVDPDEAFAYSRKRSDEVGRNCPEEAYRARVSLFVTAGNKNETRNLYIDADAYVNEETLLDPDGVTDIEDIAADASISKSEARRRYEEACHEGHINACIYAGNFFLYGEGGPRSVSTARELYAQACEYGSSNGCDSAERLRERTPAEKEERAARIQAAREAERLRIRQQRERLAGQPLSADAPSAPPD